MSYILPGNIDEVEFTVFDTETTGLEPESGDRIVEIAGIRIKGSKRISTFQSLINPGVPISQSAFRVNKITENMLKDAPLPKEILPKFLDFIRGSCLCSYNAVFDLGFLNNELKIIGESLSKEAPTIDILTMAKRLMPGLERYALWFVAESFGVKNKQEHRALSDVEMTLEVFERLSGILKSKGVSDFSNFLSLFGLNVAFSENIHNQKLAKIQEAIDLGVKLNIKYLSRSSAAVSLRDVVPKEIKKDRNNTYLVGHCCLRNEERTFRVDGILHIEII